MESKATYEQAAEDSRRALEERKAHAQGLLDRGDLQAAVAWMKESHPRQEVPDVLEACERCHQHAALYRNDTGRYKWVCGPCGPRVSIFTLPVPWYEPVQVAADLALRETGKHDLKGTLTPLVWEGD